MSLVINNNMMAANTARNLNIHYSNLGTSTQRLSSGLRINSAADDAAGLAIRELQRADIATLQQGARNANDAISLIQTADGALQTIDEQLIRMKELAEQAATGTYDSTQRLMIESEYQALASEITRIANATDFNGIKLLDGSLSGTHNGSGLKSTGALKVHFGTANDSAEDYYYIQIGNSTAAALGVGDDSEYYTVDDYVKIRDYAVQAVYNDEYDRAYTAEYNAQIAGGATQGVANAAAQAEGERVAGIAILNFSANMDAAYTLNNAAYENAAYDANIAAGIPESEARGAAIITATNFSIADARAVAAAHANPVALEAFDEMRDILPAGATLKTQEAAQTALVAINDAIVSKDKIRAHLGAIQNRLEATINNLNIQAENMQAAESRISDVDVGIEMTEFVRNQILTQSAVAMLSQANSLPRMAMQLIGG